MLGAGGWAAGGAAARTGGVAGWAAGWGGGGGGGVSRSIHQAPVANSATAMAPPASAATGFFFSGRGGGSVAGGGLETPRPCTRDGSPVAGGGLTALPLLLARAAAMWLTRGTMRRQAAASTPLWRDEPVRPADRVLIVAGSVSARVAQRGETALCLRQPDLPWRP
ncbi:MAG: hypothetical protein C0502_08360 [Opitutus sp.]|nr:hypothetical protein [Opitutus sp.]